MDFFGSIAAEVIGGLLLAGLIGLLGLLWRWRRQKAPTPSPSPTGGGEQVPPLLGRGLGGGNVSPLRILVAASRPWDVEPWLDTEDEWEKLRAELQPKEGDEPPPIHLEFLPAATRQALRAALQQGCDALHFTGHGTEDGCLVLEGDYGLAQPMDADSFLRSLPADRARHPCLVVLSACHSEPVGAALRKAGVDHVVAVDRDTPIPVRAATRYAAAFYCTLALGGRLDHAHYDGQNAAGLDKFAGDRSPLVQGPPVSERFRLLTRRKRVRLAWRRGGNFSCRRPPVAGPEFPLPRASLVGRASDLWRATHYLTQSRLVTVHGPGGVGKTALADVLGRRWWETARFPGGLAKIELESRAGGAGLLEGLHVRLAPDFSFPPEAETTGERARALAARLASRWAGPEGVAVLRTLLEELPGLRLLVTGRHALGLPEEQDCPLEELELAQAVALFEDRCDVQLAKEERPTVEAICERLDRLPLAVEQAAGWVNGQSPKSILAGLEQSALSLTPAEEAAYPERQRGLAVNFRYSFERIEEAGRRLWCCFAVFLGQPTRAALERVAGFEGWERGLHALTHWRLARREGERYAMLPTVREYAALILKEEAANLELDETELRARHAAHYLAYAQTHTDDYDALEAELPDIFAGFNFVVVKSTRDDERVAAYNWAVQWFLRTRGYWGELLRWLNEAAVACEALDDRAGLASIYNNIGDTVHSRGDYEAALEWYRQFVALQEELGDRAGLATSYNNIGLIHKARGDYEAALEWYRQFVALQEELGDRAGLATTLHNMGHIALAQRDLRGALDFFSRSRDLYTAIGLGKDVAEEEEMIAEVQRRMG